MPPVREVIATSFSADGAVLGERCVDSVRAHWPAELVVYRDDDVTDWRVVRDSLPSTRPDAEKPTNYIWDARKFAVKPFVWLDAAVVLENGVLTWLDADTFVKAPVPMGFSTLLLGDADVAYLGRGTMHPEAGFVVFRIPEALPLLRWCVDCYRTGSFRSLDDGWTDCHVLRAGLVATGIRAVDLTSHLCHAWRSNVDAFALSPLGPYVEHFKGPRRKREALTV